MYISSIVSPSPQPSDNLVIVNRTDDDIFIEVEYLEEPRDIGYCLTVAKQMGKIEMSIDIFSYDAITILNSNRQELFLLTAPTWFLTRIDGRSPYEFLREIPMLERIRAVVKTFKITNRQSDVLFSLEDARGEDLAIRSLGGRGLDYYLEIQREGVEKTIDNGLAFSIGGENQRFYSIGRSGAIKTWDVIEQQVKEDIVSGTFGCLTPKMSSGIVSELKDMYKEVVKQIDNL
jgi:hypothetical protein